MCNDVTMYIFLGAMASVILIAITGASVECYLNKQKVKNYHRPIMTCVVGDSLYTTATSELVLCEIKGVAQHNTCLWRTKKGEYFTTDNDSQRTIATLTKSQAMQFVRDKLKTEPKKLVSVMQAYVDKDYRLFET